MANPLSVTASLAGLVTLADLVFCRIFKYVQAVKGASKEISALSSEVGALYGILNNLRLVSLQLDDQTFLSTARVDHITSCAKTLENLKSILDKDSTSSGNIDKIEVIRRKLHWTFSSSQVKGLLAEIARHKSTLSLALNADSMLGLVQSLSIQGAIRESVDEIKMELKQRHEADVRIALDAKRQKTLNSFGNYKSKEEPEDGLAAATAGHGIVVGRKRRIP